VRFIGKFRLMLEIRLDARAFLPLLGRKLLLRQQALSRLTARNQGQNGQGGQSQHAVFFTLVEPTTSAGERLPLGP
jgi:hypothetical protein